MNHTPVLRRLSIVNATLLVVHEIDSAFWREWDLFGLLVASLAQAPLAVAELRASAATARTGT